MNRYNNDTYNKFHKQNIKAITTLAKYHYSYVKDKSLYEFEDFLQECLIMIWKHVDKYGLYSVRISNIIKRTVLNLNKEER